MTEPENYQIACIGCGAMNPVVAEVCSGCGHRFAGPGGGMMPPLTPESAPQEPRGSYQLTRRPSEPTALGCLAQVIGIILTTIAAVIAFGIAFFKTCVTVASNPFALGWAGLAGLAAGGAVVGLAIWFWNIWSSNRHPIKSERRKEDQ